MNAKSISIGLVIVLATATLASANPIPIPPPASMPLEEMYIEIHPSGDNLHATFTGEFTFDYIPIEVLSMMFPVPPDAENIGVWQDGVELPWGSSGEEYPTILPEHPTIPMIEWPGPFPVPGAVFRVDYEHDLVKRPNEFIFFYALGTGKYFPTYDKTTTAYLDILLPTGFAVRGVWLDDTPHDYEIAGSNLKITVQSHFGPITKDLIVSLVPNSVTVFVGCGRLVQGVECVLFQADTGALYILDNLAHFQVGDRVRVYGLLNPFCLTICMQGDGCIHHNTICPCLRCDLNADSKVDFADYVQFASYWLDTSCNSQNCWCRYADLSANGFVNVYDLKVFAECWLAAQPPTEPERLQLSSYYAPHDNPIVPSAPGYPLPLDLTAITNYATMDARFKLGPTAPVLQQNGFAVVEYDFSLAYFPDAARDDIIEPYEYLRQMDVPLFITADTLLHLYHIQFDETLKDIEEREFYGDIGNLTAALLDRALAQYSQHSGDLKEAARRNVAYLSVARKLINPDAEIPPLVADVVASELAKIDAHAGFASSDIFIYQEDYSQYVPRGHYTRSEELQRYFRSLMWYGRIAFLLKGSDPWCNSCEALISPHDAEIQTLQAVLLATSLDQVEIGSRSGRQIWDRMYAVTSFYVGLADDLTPYEYLSAIDRIFGRAFEPIALENEDHFFALKLELARLRSPQIYGGTGNIFVNPPITPDSLNEVLDKTKGMRFMGQRFIPDSYMFQQLVNPQVPAYTGSTEPFTLGWTGANWGRCYPRGLDVAAILGSDRAKAILIREGDTDYVNYWQQFNQLKAEFDAFDVSDWNRNLYWGWLYALRSLIDDLPEGYPNFMRTDAWQNKQLNAALASWAELRHDTILYAKQSYTPGTTSIPPPAPPGCVEPVPDFYGRLLALTRTTRQGLIDLDALSPEATERLVNLEEILSRLIEISNKELTNQYLSEDDRAYVKWFGKTLEGAVLGVDETGVKTTLVADVHTHGVEAKVVEEGVGYVDLIIVACSTPDGSIFLAAGPVLSYYEFKHPMSDRLTDEAWRDLLDSPGKPKRPTWYRPLMP